MSEFDIFVSSMTVVSEIFNIITLDHMKSLKNITLDGNTGHFGRGDRLGLATGLGRQATEDRFDLSAPPSRPALSSSPGGLTPHSARSSNRARQLQLIRAELPSNGLSAAIQEFKKMPASGISSELSAHQKARPGAIAHSRAHLCPRASFLFVILPRLATAALRLGVIGSWRPSVFFISIRRYGRRSGQPSSSSLARRACVHVLPFSLVLLLFAVRRYVTGTRLLRVRLPGHPDVRKRP